MNINSKYFMVYVVAGITAIIGLVAGLTPVAVGGLAVIGITAIIQMNKK
jgi:hypothetical protein